MAIESVLILAGIAAILFVGFKILTELQRPKEGRELEMLQKHLFEIQKGLQTQDKSINAQMNQSREVLVESLQKQFATTAKMIKDVQEGSKAVAESLTRMETTNQQVVGFAEQMKSLENILKNPKQRGILGEFFLENMLSQQLPPTHFKMQYAFKNGEAVDAVILVRDKVIPVDAKFSLENYNAMMDEKVESERQKLEKEFKSDLKKRIDETSKYVRPEEGTTDFAFMFIPADGVFYNLLSQKVGTLDINTVDLVEYAFKKKVILVSPMTFYAYLQTVMQALKALTIEKKAVEIQKNVGDLARHLLAYEDHMTKLGSHLSTTVNAYNNAGKEFGKIDKDVIRITEGEARMEADIAAIDKPASFDDMGSNVKVTLKAASKRGVEVE